jgi:guanosine-3',5'-bis(diphosphate) 3'-pyrophosphohydrolase
MVSAVLHPPSTGKGKPRQAQPCRGQRGGGQFCRVDRQPGLPGRADVEQVRRAYRFADEAHLGQIRNSGEPYITHPIAVAAQCAEWKLDAQALMAALLHDAMEDCGVTKPS